MAKKIRSKIRKDYETVTWVDSPALKKTTSYIEVTKDKPSIFSKIKNFSVIGFLRNTFLIFLTIFLFGYFVNTTYNSEVIKEYEINGYNVKFADYDYFTNKLSLLKDFRPVFNFSYFTDSFIGVSSQNSDDIVCNNGFVGSFVCTIVNAPKNLLDGILSSDIYYLIAPLAFIADAFYSAVYDIGVILRFVFYW